MVFINSKKFACESCIKGHRSSSCHHTDRALYEIKKKGRPVSQCEKCRELRKTKRMHSKCMCSSGNDAEASGSTTPTLPVPASTSRQKRFKPIAPSLPNGLKGYLASQDDDTPTSVNPRTRVDTLLNPCPCKSIWDCHCEASRSDAGPANDGLATLARAAALCCAPAVPDSNSQPIIGASASLSASSLPFQHEELTPAGHDGRDCCSGHPAKVPSKSSPHIHTHVKEHFTRGPDLPPLLNAELHSFQRPPAFPPLDIPPLSEIAEIAGTDCCCGVRCSCPGCVEHRGAAHTSADFKDCKDGCGTCVDHEGSLELPAASTFHHVHSSTNAFTMLSGSKYLDAFLACAAQLPPPPSARTIYHARASGHVVVPKLQCGCKGGCGCPEDQCGCGDACEGCGDDSNNDLQPTESSASATQQPALFGVSEDFFMRDRESGDTVMAS